MHHPKVAFDEAKVFEANAIRHMTSSDGWKILEKRINERIVEGWEKFMRMPVDKKTNKVAINHQAEYMVLKSILDEIQDELDFCERNEGRRTTDV